MTTERSRIVIASWKYSRHPLPTVQICWLQVIKRRTTPHRDGLHPSQSLGHISNCLQLTQRHSCHVRKYNTLHQLYAHVQRPL